METLFNFHEFGRGAAQELDDDWQCQVDNHNGIEHNEQG
jgi:hypothetical protein